MAKVGLVRRWVSKLDASRITIAEEKTSPPMRRNYLFSISVAIRAVHGEYNVLDSLERL
jgi:hypothetical protein